jgi:hypothetical protein
LELFGRFALAALETLPADVLDDLALLAARNPTELAKRVGFMVGKLAATPGREGLVAAADATRAECRKCGCAVCIAALGPTQRGGRA